MHFGDAHIIALQEAPEDFRQEAPLGQANAPDNAEIDEGDPAVRRQDQVSLMHVGMEDAMLDGRRQEAARNLVRQRLAVEARPVERLRVG